MVVALLLGGFCPSGRVEIGHLLHVKKGSCAPVAVVINVSKSHTEKLQDLTRESLDSLLEWLNPDRERAGVEYEKIRSRLIRIFAGRGCRVPEELADATINRVAGKVKDVSGDYEGNPAYYFYGVARNIYLEYSKARPVALPMPPPPPNQEETDLRFDCLERCLDDLAPRNSEIIVAYYGVDEENKKEGRRKLALEFGIGSNALWIRAHRIRDSLRRCMDDCLRQRKQ